MCITASDEERRQESREDESLSSDESELRRLLTRFRNARVADLPRLMMGLRVEEVKSEMSNPESAITASRKPNELSACRSTMLSPIATPGRAESEGVEKIPKGRFWMGKS